jgi:hypothetical protein
VPQHTIRALHSYLNPHGFVLYLEDQSDAQLVATAASIRWQLGDGLAFENFLRLRLTRLECRKHLKLGQEAIEHDAFEFRSANLGDRDIYIARKEVSLKRDLASLFRGVETSKVIRSRKVKHYMCSLDWKLTYTVHSTIHREISEYSWSGWFRYE